MIGECNNYLIWWSLGCIGFFLAGFWFGLISALVAFLSDNKVFVYAMPIIVTMIIDKWAYIFTIIFKNNETICNLLYSIQIRPNYSLFGDLNHLVVHFNTGHRIWHAEKDNVALFGRGGGIGMKNMIYTTVRKPSFMVKMALITVLFIAALIEQVSNTGLYANSFGTQEHMTVILLLIHTFSYSDFYQNIFFIGFIFLIPDIVKEEYIERSSIMKYSSRNTAGKRAIEKIIFFSILYLAWFAVITMFIGGIGTRDFSLTWPRFMEIQQNRIASQGVAASAFINLPDGGTNYPALLVFVLMFLRSSIGMAFLGLLALLVTLVTAKTRNGIGVLVILVSIAYYVTQRMGGAITYWNDAAPVGQKRSYFNITKATIQPLFTACSVQDQFMPWMRYGIIAGILLCVITGAGIMLYYRKGDLGDEDRDE